MGEEVEEEDMGEEEEVEDTVEVEEGWDGKTLHRMATSLVGLSVLVELFGGLLMSNVISSRPGNPPNANMSGPPRSYTK